MVGSAVPHHSGTESSCGGGEGPRGSVVNDSTLRCGGMVGSAVLGCDGSGVTNESLPSCARGGECD